MYSTTVPRWLAAILVVWSCCSAQEISLISAPDDPLVLGTQGNSDANGCALSAQGRYVAFTSEGSNLVPGDSNGLRDVFVHDRLTGVTRRVNHFADGSEPVWGSAFSDLAMSSDVPVLVFATRDDLLQGGEHGSRVLYWLNWDSGELKLVTRLADGSPGNLSSMDGVSVSADGRYVLFDSADSGFVAGDTDGAADVFRFDADTGLIELVSTDASGAHTVFPVDGWDLSDDGSHALLTTAAAWTAGDNNNMTDVFIKDIATGAVTRVSVDSNGVEGFLSSSACALSGNAEKALFQTGNSTIVPGDSNFLADLFLHNLTSGDTMLANTGSMGELSDGETECGFLGNSGTSVAFSSAADSLAQSLNGSLNGLLNAYLKDLQTGELLLLAQASEPLVVSATSADTSMVCLTSDAPDVVADDTNAANDVFVVEPGMMAERVSVASAPVPLSTDLAASYAPAVSADGSLIVFVSQGRFIDADAGYSISEPPSSLTQVYLHDRGDNVLLSRGLSGEPGQGRSDEPAISPNGRYVAFRSRATDLVSGVNSSTSKIYRVDLDSMEIVLVSEGVDGTGVEGHFPSVANDGSVAYVSDEANLPAPAKLGSAKGLANGVDQVYHWRGPQQVELVSVTSAGELGSGRSKRPHLSGDGRYVVFLSDEDNLVDPPHSAQEAVFLRDLLPGTTTLVSNPMARADANRAQVSTGGTYVVFDQLIGVERYVFLYDRLADTTIEITGPGGTTSFDQAYEPVLSNNGLHVVFKMLGGGENDLVRYDVTGQQAQVLELPDGFHHGPVFPHRFTIDDTGTQVVVDTGFALVPEDTNRAFTDVYRYQLEPVTASGSGLPFADGFEQPVTPR